jgi:DNA-binding PadR family transcriptional regulator
LFRKDIRLETLRYVMSEARSASEASITAQNLTAFQQNILTILAEEPRYGLAVKRELEAYYGSEVNHGRLYPNLDDLVDEGLVEKSELDKRTNQYALTDAGHDVVLGQIEWVLDRFVTDETRAAEIEALLGA